MKKQANLKWLLSLAILVALFLLPLVTVGAQDAETTKQLNQPIFSLTLGEVVGIVVGLMALFVGFGKILWDWAHHRGSNLDTALTARVQASQSDREWVERLEKAHERGGEALKTALSAVVGVLDNVAPLTKLKIDDAFRDLLKDIQTPGAPDSLVAAAPPLPESPTSAG